MSSNPSIHWHLKSFDELTNKELYSILQLRSEVFVVEQNCVFQDMDDKDFLSLHIMGINEANQLLAYSRIVPSGVSFQEVSIGRVVTSSVVRRSGAGMELMEQSIQMIEQEFGHVSIRIGAQLYLKKFYECFGFVQMSEMYLEDGIEHIEMVRTKNANGL